MSGSFASGARSTREEHETFGVASLRKEHVCIHDGVMVFEYPAKGSVKRTLEIRDAQACDVVTALRRRRSGGPNLFVYKHEQQWVEVHAHDVNDYIKAAAGEEFSAKDFRTWSGTVLAADALAEHDPVPKSRSGRRRAVVDAVATVAKNLGNTPAVSRSSYIDPRVVDSFEDGDTISARLGRGSVRGKPGRRQKRGAGSRTVEEAVIDLLDEPSRRSRRDGN